MNKHDVASAALAAICFVLLMNVPAYAVNWDSKQIHICDPDIEYDVTLDVTEGTTAWQYIASADERNEHGCAMVSANVHPLDGYHVVRVAVNGEEYPAQNTTLITVTEDTHVVIALELIEPEVKAARYRVYLPNIGKD